MVRAGVVAIAALLLLSLWASSGHATTVIYYSAPEGAYGWCAGYSRGKSDSCAQKNCVKNNGTACDLVLECKDGWGAVALADEPAKGMGGTCGMRELYGARSSALVHCVVEANALCSTDYAWNRNGDAVDEDDNADFDMVWYAQALLMIRGFKGAGYVMGEMSRTTHDSIGEFQKQLGREPTGILDEEIFDRLLDAVAGRQRFIEILKRDVLDRQPDYFRDITHGEASVSVPAVNFSTEMAGWKDEHHRLLALATILSSSGTKCTLPAQEASVTGGDPSAGIWSVTCAEGDYTLLLADDGSRTIIMSGTTRTGPAKSEPTKQQ